MNRPHDQSRGSGPGRVTGDGPVVRAAAYVALFLLGAVQALIGTFQYSRGPDSLVAMLFAAGILATCLLGSWGMHKAAGGVLPAAGWFGISIVLGLSTAGGSVLVADTAQGKWFLFGGAVCAAAGAVAACAWWGRRAR